MGLRCSSQRFTPKCHSLRVARNLRKFWYSQALTNFYKASERFCSKVIARFAMYLKIKKRTQCKGLTSWPSLGYHVLILQYNGQKYNINIAYTKKKKKLKKTCFKKQKSITEETNVKQRLRFSNDTRKIRFVIFFFISAYLNRKLWRVTSIGDTAHRRRIS